MNQVKLYLNALFDIILILIATLSEVDLIIRIVAGVIGIILGILTSIKFWQDIQLKKVELRRKEFELDQMVLREWNKKP